ncbi:MULTISPECIES: hypothetical protein [unclassified Pseudomonas]|uniref:hypothetical protein n=1 Tax=unclassified Pseudomonas TaxID=196821 RepID=UPI0021BB201A|nr:MULTISPECIES: hypothetical protein [unclassified Pseudomonas]MCT8163892.1 hypothetical protein [Pseudomonas sp. HD6422]MCT8182757.1 hypothetical protein [Pseudomonas sp. HD6421]
MKYIIVLCTLLSGCGGRWLLYEHNHEEQFKCDMDPHMQFCLNPAELVRYIESQEQRNAIDEIAPALQ